MQCILKIIVVVLNEMKKLTKNILKCIFFYLIALTFQLEFQSESQSSQASPFARLHPLNTILQNKKKKKISKQIALLFVRFYLE